ncbi:MAG TPA: hypothetical protein VE621_09045 [Bryobacteraceae bacterium]|jgi:hypothetical protein|nr:hypothetical protein [Bryobacteraceae bacterium]
MPTPYRSTVTIDGQKFDAVSTSVAFNTLKDRAGMPEMGSLQTNIRVYVDFHDDGNMPHGTLKTLFELANVVTRDKIKDMKIEFWKDDAKQDALCSYSFKGWISKFETLNPMPAASPQSSTSDLSPHSTLNHLLFLELEPALNQQNFREIKMTN